MSDRSEKAGTFIVSGLACFGLAAICGVLAWWLLDGFFSAQADLNSLQSTGRRRTGGVIGIVAIFGFVAALASLVFIGLGAKILVHGLLRAARPAKEEPVDDWWKDMPAPKGTPTSGSLSTSLGDRCGRKPGRS